MQPAYTLSPVGYVRGGRTGVRDDGWADEVARIELVDGFGPDALAGLDAFSHVEVVYLFDRVPASAVEHGSRDPRGNTQWPRVGIFAQRAKDRSNQRGVSVARLPRCDGTTLTVQGLDAIDATPVFDIKPVTAEFLPQGEVRQPPWSREPMRNYWR